jgi:hypothetical protein
MKKITFILIAIAAISAASANAQTTAPADAAHKAKSHHRKAKDCSKIKDEAKKSKCEAKQAAKKDAGAPETTAPAAN